MGTLKLPFLLGLWACRNSTIAWSAFPAHYCCSFGELACFVMFAVDRVAVLLSHPGFVVAEQVAKWNGLG